MSQLRRAQLSGTMERRGSEVEKWEGRERDHIHQRFKVGCRADIYSQLCYDLHSK